MRDGCSFFLLLGLVHCQQSIWHLCISGDKVLLYRRTNRAACAKASALPCVREKLLSLQRDLAASNDVVMDGRDIGTNILPSAELKVYLTASSAVRAKRRYDELVAKGAENIDIEKIEQDIIQRDKQDMERKTAPLKRADDAVLIDSSDMTIEQVTDTIVGLARERM